MKLLLIDDEPHVIEALRLLESWANGALTRFWKPTASSVHESLPCRNCRTL